MFLVLIQIPDSATQSNEPLWGLIGVLIGGIITFATTWLWYRITENKNLIKLRAVLSSEIHENVNLLTPKVDENNWPSFLLSDMYTANLGNLNLLKENELNAILLHYKDVQRFIEAQRDAIEGHQHSSHIFRDRAKKTLDSGKKALKLLS